MTTDPTNQHADQPAAQPTAPPSVPPASPNADHVAASSPSEGAAQPRRLVRRTDDRMLGGICSGLAAHFNVDPTLVRLLTVVLTVLGMGTVVIAYLVAWVIVPADSRFATPVGVPQPHAS
jgi:phage shock protein C